MEKQNQNQNKTCLGSIKGWLFKKRRWNYYRCMWAYAVAVSGLGAVAIGLVQDIPPIDCLFLSVSAFTGTGLSTLEMSRLSHETFIVVFVLMFFGGTIFLLLPPIYFRVYSFRKMEPLVQDFLAHHVTDLDNPKIKYAIKLISDRRALVRGLRTVSLAVVAYILLWLGIGSGLFYAVLDSRDPIPEIEERKFNRGWVAVFTVVSAFNNAGITQMSDSLLSLRTWPGAWVLLSLLILAGNNFAPVFLRGLLRIMHIFSKWCAFDRDAVRYALDHPRQMTTHLFDKRNTRVLLYLLLGINLFQWALFLVSTLPRDFLPSSLNHNLSSGQLAGAGLFQTISTRVAGFEMLPLNDLNQGMLVVYVVFMYISMAPFVSRMYVTEQTYDENDQNTPSHQSVEDTKSRFSHSYLFRHLSWLTLCFVVIIYIEDADGEISPLTDPDRSRITPFSVLFELISAYGNVGLSLGVSSANYSLSGSCSVVSKLLMISLMMLGKHRGLPTHTDSIRNFNFSKLRKALRSAKEAARNVKKQHKRARRTSILDMVPGIRQRRKSSVHDEAVAQEVKQALLEGFQQVHQKIVTPPATPYGGIKAEGIKADRAPSAMMEPEETLAKVKERLTPQVGPLDLRRGSKLKRLGPSKRRLKGGPAAGLRRSHTLALGLAQGRDNASPPPGSLLRRQIMIPSFGKSLGKGMANGHGKGMANGHGNGNGELSNVNEDEIFVQGLDEEEEKVGLILHSLVWWSWVSGEDEDGEWYYGLLGDEAREEVPEKFAYCKWYTEGPGAEAMMIPWYEEESESEEEEVEEEEEDDDDDDDDEEEEGRMGMLSKRKPISQHRVLGGELEVPELGPEIEDMDGSGRPDDSYGWSAGVSSAGSPINMRPLGDDMQQAGSSAAWSRASSSQAGDHILRTKSFMPSWVSTKWNSVWQPVDQQRIDEERVLSPHELIESDPLFRQYFPCETRLASMPEGAAGADSELHASALSFSTRRQPSAPKRAWNVVRSAVLMSKLLPSRARSTMDNDVEAGAEDSQMSQLRRQNTIQGLRQKLCSESTERLGPNS